jgi:lipoprotein-anchoring transpeptidase ErfK/SrfK
LGWESRALAVPDFPQSETGLLARVLNKLDIHAKPDVNSPVVKTLYEDALLPWLREVDALNNNLNVLNQRWVETPDGYIWASDLQPVRNIPNQPVNAIPDPSVGGFWGEVTVPYADLVLENPPPRGPAVKWLAANNVPNRLYYTQVMWVDQVKQGDDGRPIYRINERYGSYGDIFWADGAAFRILTNDDVAPLSPDVDPNEKTVKVNITYETLSCYEGKREVYFCRVSSGFEDKFTPLGDHLTWRKLVSVHMAGGTVAAGYDTPGISWTNLFAGEGVAVHSTFWHNDFGQKRSHGCVNCSPDDAHWIWRWTTPNVPLYPGDVTVQGPGGTHVIVEQRLV